MIIELFGLPACGKSTYLKQYMTENDINILQKYIYSNSRIVRNINKIKEILKCFFLYNKDFHECFKVLSKIKFKNIKTKIKMYMYLISYVSVINTSRKKYKNKNCFLDEGILNVIWAIIYNSNTYEEEHIKYLIRMLDKYIGEKIIYINTDKEIIYERLNERANKGGSELEHDIKSKNLSFEKAYKIIENIYNFTKRRHAVVCKKMN